MAVSRQDGGATGLRRASPGGPRRRRWAMAGEGDDGGEEEADAALTLVPFSPAPLLSFGAVRVGTSRLRRLALENPNAEPVRVVVGRPPPAAKGFAVQEPRHWLLQSGERILISVTWTPLEGGKVRELITFVVNDVVKHQAVLLGSAEQSTKKKKSLWDTVKKRAPSRQSQYQKKLPIIKNINETFHMSKKPGRVRSPLQACENLEVNGCSISPSGNSVILLENSFLHSPTDPILQEKQRVTNPPLSMGRSIPYFVTGTVAFNELQQDTKQTCTVMPKCDNLVETKLESGRISSVKVESSSTDSVCTPENLKSFPLNHRKILSPDSFVHDSYELCEEPSIATRVPVLSPDQFLKENQIVIQPTSQVHKSVSHSSSLGSYTICSQQKERMQFLLFLWSLIFQASNLMMHTVKKMQHFSLKSLNEMQVGARKMAQIKFAPSRKNMVKKGLCCATQLLKVSQVLRDKEGTH
uniref:abnormal spindle-like microcephaly-associated protein homolog n=1 Tax=Podarcis muralis TaxID=64176 RepID=UPI00109FA109|nr:abnormal spindle-like microcephaly-associated protein homolog [Podarcis muralis]